MKNLFTILAIVVAFTHSHAQSWSLINVGATRYFVNNHHYLRAVAIDSVAAYGADLHYYPFRSVRRPSLGSFGQDTTGSWMGKVVIKKNDGRFLIPNYWNDTIEIRSLANVGDSWTFYQDSSTKYYTATIIATDTMTLPGGLDSVKRIQLLAYDNGVLQTADSFHQAEIVLSKQQGICAAMEFYMFPFHAPGDTVIYDDYYLVTSMQPLLYPTHWPITDPKPGPYAATFRRVHFDNVDSAAFNVMNVGDVYQYTVCVQSPANIITTCIEPGYRQDSIVSKTMVSGGIQYVVQGWSAYKQYMFGQLYYHVTPRVDTFVLSATAPHLGIYLPETPKPLWYYDGDIMYYYPDDTTFCLQGEKYVAYSYWVAGCTYSEHKPGLGQVKFAFFDGTNPSVNGANIFYYNRNGISCGIPLVPDTTQPVSVSNATERQLNIYPNPAANELAIESVAGYSVQLVNMMGQVVYAKDLCGEKERINVSQLADGVYLVKVYRDKEPVLSRKVLVQH